MIEKIKSNPIRLTYRALVSWTPTDPYELALALRLFCFSDASHGSLTGYGSLECSMIILGCAKARNGTILCMGNLLDSVAKKINRVCRSSLSAESISLANVCDISVWTRVVCLELLVGEMFQELVLPCSTYKLVTPFGAPPLAENVAKELGVKEPLSCAGLMEADKAPGKQAETWDSKELYASSDRLNVVNLLKTLVLTDSANAYSSVLSGNPNVSERQTRIALSAVRDLAETIVLSFIDKTSIWLMLGRRVTDPTWIY